MKTAVSDHLEKEAACHFPTVMYTESGLESKLLSNLLM